MSVSCKMVPTLPNKLWLSVALSGVDKCSHLLNLKKDHF